MDTAIIFKDNISTQDIKKKQSPRCKQKNHPYNVRVFEIISW